MGSPSKKLPVHGTVYTSHMHHVGLFRLRGMLLFELFVVSYYLLKRDEKHMKKSDVNEATRYLINVIEESSLILSFEPENTLEGQRYKMAQDYRQRAYELLK